MLFWYKNLTQSLSKMITVSAAVRLIPRPPARVLKRNKNTSGSSLKCSIWDGKGMRSVNNTSISGVRMWKHMLGHLSWVQNLLKTNENYRLSLLKVFTEFFIISKHSKHSNMIWVQPELPPSLPRISKQAIKSITRLQYLHCYHSWECSGLSRKNCWSWSEFWEIQTLIRKEMCKKFLVLTKSCRSRTNGPAFISNTVLRSISHLAQSYQYHLDMA